MTNFFELLGIPESAALSEDELQRRYHKVIAAVHPDLASSEAERAEFTSQSSAINEARDTLANPVKRLRHLIDLRAPGTALNAAPGDDLMNLFQMVGTALQHADSFLAKKRETTTMLGKALLAEEEIGVQTTLQEVLGAVSHLQNEAPLQDGPVRELLRLYGRLSFLQKWQNQLNERLLFLITS